MYLQCSDGSLVNLELAHGIDVINIHQPQRPDIRFAVAAMLPTGHQQHIHWVIDTFANEKTALRFSMAVASVIEDRLGKVAAYGDILVVMAELEQGS